MINEYYSRVKAELPHCLPWVEANKSIVQGWFPLPAKRRKIKWTKEPFEVAEVNRRGEEIKGSREGYTSEQGWALQKGRKGRQHWDLCHLRSGKTIGPGTRTLAELKKIANYIESRYPGLGLLSGEEIVDYAQSNRWVLDAIQGDFEEAELSEEERTARKEAEELEREAKAQAKAYNRVKERLGEYYLPYYIPPSVEITNELVEDLVTNEQKEKRYIISSRWSDIDGALAAQVIEHNVRNALEERQNTPYLKWKNEFEYQLTYRINLVGYGIFDNDKERSKLEHNIEWLRGKHQKKGFEWYVNNYPFFGGWGSSQTVIIPIPQRVIWDYPEIKPVIADVLQGKVDEAERKELGNKIYSLRKLVDAYGAFIVRVEGGWDKELIRLDKEWDKIDTTTRSYKRGNPIFHREIAREFKERAQSIISQIEIHKEPLSSIVTEQYMGDFGLSKMTPGGPSKWAFIDETVYIPEINAIGNIITWVEPKQGMEFKFYVGASFNKPLPFLVVKITNWLQAVDYRKLEDLPLTYYNEKKAKEGLQGFLNFIGYRPLDSYDKRVHKIKNADVKRYFAEPDLDPYDANANISDGLDSLLTDMGERPPGFFYMTKKGRITFIWPEPWNYTKWEDGKCGVEVPKYWKDIVPIDRA